MQGYLKYRGGGAGARGSAHLPRKKFVGGAEFPGVQNFTDWQLQPTDILMKKLTNMITG